MADCEHTDTNFITALRFLCCIQIFLIHYFVRIDLRDYMWVFVGAVPCFLYMSAFLYGVNKCKLDNNLFFKRRWISISSTYYPFLLFAFLYIFFLFSETDKIVDLKNLFFGLVCSLLFLPDVKTLPFCGHLWFIQTLVACYIVLWFCSKWKVMRRLFESLSLTMLFVIVLLLMSLVYRGRFPVYVFCYLWMFYNAEKIQNYVICNVKKIKHILLHAAILAGGYLLFFLGESVNIYNWVYYRYWISSIIGIETIVLFMMLFKFFQIHKLNFIVFFGASISMEIYLVHHLFVFDYPLYYSLPLTIFLSVILKLIREKYKYIWSSQK